VSHGRRGFWKDNSLSLTFLGLLLLALVGQALSGVAAFNSQQIADGASQLSLAQYLVSSSFGVDVAENWQSEYLQFALYIVATVWLIQRGSSESKKPEDIGPQSDEAQKVGPHATADSPGWRRPTVGAPRSTAGRSVRSCCSSSSGR
jgi:hypothetical protein